ncbi:MAG: glucokinase [Acidobacteria bacterium]|nr:glucokinase [Acidobacteriota bacterium]
MILAGDIGGTNSRLACFEWKGGRPRPVVERTYPSRAHSGLQEILEKFIRQHTMTIDLAGFGVAGIVRKGRCEAVNLPWVVDAADLARSLRLNRVALVNDLEAMAQGISVLDASEHHTLNAGSPEAEGNMAVIAAGTGLGEAALYWNGQTHLPFATEGGHTDFAPRGDLEMDLCRHLRIRFGRVSVERVVSGPGLLNIFEFLKSAEGGKDSAGFSDPRASGDAAAAISKSALEGTCPVSVRALGIFVSLYGAEAGNLALKTMATGGLWIGGGIAPKILEKLKGPEFMSAFTDKGRLQPLMESIPVRVILNEKTALLGAALRAAGS